MVREGISATVEAIALAQTIGEDELQERLVAALYGLAFATRVPPKVIVDGLYKTVHLSDDRWEEILSAFEEIDAAIGPRATKGDVL